LRSRGFFAIVKAFQKRQEPLLKPAAIRAAGSRKGGVALDFIDSACVFCTPSGLVSPLVEKSASALFQLR
jgi:hypothetical protein